MANADEGELWQITTHSWFWLAILNSVIHQIYVWLGWRAELGHQWFTKRWGAKAVQAFGMIFIPLFAGRVIFLIPLAVSNANSLDIPPWLRALVAILLAIPSIYLGYSVARFFGVNRALGADHFDPAYRNLPMVTDGIFRFTNNGMYMYGFLILWAIGVGFASKAALIAAGFNHLYIWVHYYTVEKPDMEIIYGSRLKEKS
ncbi:MAG: hypothetical protein JW757_10995 [Anaerolineales bacterium]|nr:hypothetical protein [Anaerolineales bacterium]